MIYTSTKSLQFLSVLVYTILKNLTIVVIAYSEVLWFGGSVTPLLLLSFGFMVLSSIVAAWADILAALNGGVPLAETTIGLNVVCTASYSLTNLAMNFCKETRNSLIIDMLYSSLGAIFISYSSAWCIRKTTLTTYLFVVYLNKPPLAISRIIFFNALVTFGSILAILLGFFSGLIYGYSKMGQKEILGNNAWNEKDAP
ncbi:hypothetical protein BCR34DRAFT_628499 [Clohesyomyces aquaticus]|uniref:Uncharacterized protein n=1 Tax=Clohesyomyces aquaticus TaxID=1231657 RepID=A0A1Y1YIW7_9PLEO|nr:hypothetical protein BCR34DRAFT_628499 [Clohesyomyces aquaticus]